MRDLVPIDIISDFSCDSVNWVVVSYIYDALRDLVHLYNLKSVKNTHGRVLLYTFFKFYKWYQIAQRVTLTLLQ